MILEGWSPVARVMTPGAAPPKVTSSKLKYVSKAEPQLLRVLRFQFRSVPPDQVRLWLATVLVRVKSFATGTTANVPRVLRGIPARVGAPVRPVEVRKVTGATPGAEVNCGVTVPAVKVAAPVTATRSLVALPMLMFKLPPAAVKLVIVNVAAASFSSPVAPGESWPMFAPLFAATVTFPTEPVPAKVPAPVAEAFTFTTPELRVLPVMDRIPVFAFVAPV